MIMTFVNRRTALYDVSFVNERRPVYGTWRRHGDGYGRTKMAGSAWLKRCKGWQVGKRQGFWACILLEFIQYFGQIYSDLLGFRRVYSYFLQFKLLK